MVICGEDSAAPQDPAACQEGNPGLNRHTRLKVGRSTEEDTVATKANTVYNGYCVKCKEKRDFEGTVEVSKTGMNVAKGKCPVCGTTMNRILGKASA
jgi:hypothetical protein